MKLPRPTLATAGFALIWAFLILFVFYPLTRIFYDAFTNEAGAFTPRTSTSSSPTSSTCARCGSRSRWGSPRW